MNTGNDLEETQAWSTDDQLALGPPVSPPSLTSSLRFTFGALRGQKTPVTLQWADDGRNHAEVNVHSIPDRAKFAKSSAEMAARRGLELDQHVIIERLVEHSLQRVESARPVTEPTASDRPKIGNHAAGAALRVDEIDAQLAAIAPDWPKRVGEHLFVRDRQGGPEYLDTVTALFSWLDERAATDWAEGPTMISQGRYLSHLIRVAERFDGIEIMPHEPPIPNLYYMTPDLPSPSESTGSLDRFVEFFCPETELDRQLIKALIMTPSWGGPNGGRPAFLITSPEGAKQKGTGRGKSTLVQRVAELHGGAVTVDHGTSIEALKTRLLSPAAATRRILMLDNIKTHKLSWGDLEGLITDDMISGRENYVGEGRRPNTFTTVLTLNGARLSTDFSRRVVTILMGKPIARSSWEAEVAQFLTERRWHILSDIRAILASPAPALSSRLDFAPWESAVLAHLHKPEECQQLILDRRSKIDADLDERASFIATFVQRLTDRGHDPEVDVVAVDKAEVAAWLSQSTRERFTTANATSYIKLLSIEQLTERHARHADQWVWRGERAVATEPTRINPPRVDSREFAASRSDPGLGYRLRSLRVEQ
jgi:hypothetical protein